MLRAVGIPALFSGLLMILWLWALIDVITTDSMLIRNLQKSTWLFVVVFVPTLGAAMWILFGRPENASLAPGGHVGYERNPHRTSDRHFGPEDSPEWRSANVGRSTLSSMGDKDSMAARERKLLEQKAELEKSKRDLEARERSIEDRGPDPTDEPPSDQPRPGEPGD